MECKAPCTMPPQPRGLHSWLCHLTALHRCCPCSVCREPHARRARLLCRHSRRRPRHLLLYLPRPRRRRRATLPCRQRRRHQCLPTLWRLQTRLRAHTASLEASPLLPTPASARCARLARSRPSPGRSPARSARRATFPARLARWRAAPVAQALPQLVTTLDARSAPAM